jgi:hypothetical protein
MADDDDVIYVDIEARLDESAADRETTKLRDKFKRSSKVDIEPNLDEAAADRASARLRDRLSGVGKTLGDALDSHLTDATDKATDKATAKVRQRLDGIGQSFGEALGKEFTGLFGGDGDIGSHIGETLKNQLGPVTNLFSGGISVGDIPRQFQELQGSLRETVTGLKTLAPEGSKAATALANVADAAGPVAVALLGISAIFKGIQDIRGAPTTLDTSPDALGLKPTLPQGITQTPANLMPLPGATQPVQLPPGIKPGTQYQATPGSLDPFAGLLPPGMKPPAGATDPNKPSTPVVPPNPLIPSIAPPDTGGFHTSSATLGGSNHVTLVDSITSVTSPSDIPAAGAGVSNLYRVAQSLQGTPYSQQLRNDCSGMVSKLANAALGLPPTASFSTQNEGQWLAQHGFQEGMGGPNDLSIGWYNHVSDPNSGHTAATLPGGVNAESGGSHGAFALGNGAAGAGSAQFDHHMYLPMGGGGGGGYGVRPAGFGIPGLPGGGGLGPLMPPTQPNSGGGGGGPITQQPIGKGSGVGVSGGGLIGAAEQAGVMAAAIGGFGGGGIAAQAAMQEMNLAVQKTGQMGAALVSAPFETLGLSGGQMGAPTVNPLGGWPGKILGGLIGQQTNLPNIAGATQKPKQPDQDQQDDPGNGGQKGGPSGAKDDPIHTKSTDPAPTPPQGAATSAASMAGTMSAMTV